MRITELVCLHADAGHRNFDFLKIATDEGIVGWSEYNESFGGKGVTSVIDNLAPAIIGKDPCAHLALVALMQAMRRQAAGGVVAQAIGAIENALVDIAAKALGVPIYRLLGGPVRQRIRLYWSHCATYRAAWPEAMEIPPIHTLDDIAALGREVVDKGYGALKTNLLLFDSTAHLHAPGFARGEPFPELNAERLHTAAIRDQLAAFRDGAGPAVDIMVDLNFNYKTEGFLKMARAREDYDLFWVEMDSREPGALRYIRDHTEIPVASGECLFGRRDYKPFFEAHAIDVAIIDVPWNGIIESLKIADMADVAEINVAPHNFYGPLATMMSAQFSALVPNFRIMEIDPDRVPWYDELVTVIPAVEDGHMTLPTGPGWGTKIDEAAVRAHPPRGGQGGASGYR